MKQIKVTDDQRNHMARIIDSHIEQLEQDFLDWVCEEFGIEGDATYIYDGEEMDGYDVMNTIRQDAFGRYFGK